MRILLIDDQKSKSKRIESCLIEQGYLIQCVFSEKEAKIRLLQDRVFDLVLLDMEIETKFTDHGSYRMPAGIKLLNFMKLEKICIPVIVITQYSNFLEHSPVSADEKKLFLKNEYYKRTSVSNYDEYSKRVEELQDLHLMMSGTYDNYFGTIQYQWFNGNWKDVLLTAIRHLMEGKDESTDR